MELGQLYAVERRVSNIRHLFLRLIDTGYQVTIISVAYSKERLERQRDPKFVEEQKVNSVIMAYCISEVVIVCIICTDFFMNFFYCFPFDHVCFLPLCTRSGIHYWGAKQQDSCAWPEDTVHMSGPWISSQHHIQMVCILLLFHPWTMLKTCHPVPLFYKNENNFTNEYFHPYLIQQSKSAHTGNVVPHQRS